MLRYLEKESVKEPLHLTLIDPDKQSPKEAADIASNAFDGGTKGIMVGGSAGVFQQNLDETVDEIKGRVELPVILFPGDVTGISANADAIFFMSLLNSRNPYYITGAQAIGAAVVKKVGIEAIPMGYLLVEPGGAAGYVGDAHLISRDRPEIAVGYALAAQYLGMKLVYLEAGSGAAEHVPEDMISAVKGNIDIPLIVGGGIRDGKDAARVTRAGADIIVTGTTVEGAGDVKKTIREITQAMAGARA
ncbi:MAG: geranylgeranylglyceryl/heptaprenylglyceryl phosphate synthase [Candidatus Hydrothermarchaeales archaeon]